MTDEVVVKETLDDLIESSGLRLDHVAKSLGITSNYLWRIRRNPKKNVDVAFMEKIAIVLKVPVERVFNAIHNQ